MTSVSPMPAPLEAAEGPEVAPLTRHRGLVRQALMLRRTQVGLGAVAALIGLALIGPLFAPHSATGFVGAPFSGPSSSAPFGTDTLGRDVLSRFLDGGRTILAIAFIGTALGIAAGTVLGLVCGYSRRVVDDIAMRLVDLLMAFPGIVLALLLLTIGGTQDWVLIGVVALSFMPYTSRVVRSSTMQLRDSDFVLYAQSTGTPTRRILFQEILPNIAGPLTVEFGLRLAQSIGTIAGLDYLGLGAQPPTADWGLMVQENQSGLMSAPWSVLLPIIAIAALAIGVNLVTDGIAQASAGIDRTLDA
jgi:peptide/nickel transport system permease protein